MFYSQGVTHQDEWVAEQIKNKRDGTFLDVGCNHYKEINNTYYFESELNWRGIGIDADCRWKQEWEQNRKSPFICADAVNLDYAALLKEHNMPEIIDYLSIDLEPPVLTLQALKKIFETNYSFNVVTFETDWYREKSTQEESRNLFKERDYIFVCERNCQDDFYIHKRLLS